MNWQVVFKNLRKHGVMRMSTITNLMVQGNGSMIGEKSPNALRLEAEAREKRRLDEIAKYAPLKRCLLYTSLLHCLQLIRFLIA